MIDQRYHKLVIGYCWSVLKYFVLPTGCVTKAAIVVVATSIAATATIESILLDVVRFVILSSYID